MESPPGIGFNPDHDVKLPPDQRAVQNRAFDCWNLRPHAVRLICYLNVNGTHDDPSHSQ
jgi:hypothetical protein